MEKVKGSEYFLNAQGSHTFMNTRFKDFQLLFKAPLYFISSTYQIHTPAYVVSWKTLQY